MHFRVDLPIFVQDLCKLLLLGALYWPVFAANPALEDRDIAFYYGSRPPVDELRHFDQVVIQPTQILAHERAQLLAMKATTFAYVSIGEVARNSEDMALVQQRWAIGSNPLWNSLVMDMASSAWRGYLLDKHFEKLWHDGYRAFFLDTVDSYLIVAKEGKRREAQESGLVTLLAEVKKRFPGVKLILNRGFEVLDRVAPYTDGLLAESLFYGYDPLTGKHAPTKEENRAWLIKQLQRAQNDFHIPVTVLDYVDIGQWHEAETTAKKILELGFAPWVANGDLTWLGQGRVKVLPRKILALSAGGVTDQWQSETFRFAATPLEHLGYVLEQWYPDLQALPNEPLVGRYAGVLMWLPEDAQGRYGGICSRLQKEVEAGLPVVILGAIPQGIACHELVGYEGSNIPTTSPITLNTVSPLLQRPSNLPLVISGTPDVRVTDPSTIWLGVKNGDKAYHPIVVGPFGGFALAPHILMRNAAGRHQWLFDPFTFFSKAFRFPEIPVLDVTTENGRRIGIVEMRGDRLFSQEAKSSAVFDAVLQWTKTANVPITLAVIEAEFDTMEKRNALATLLAMPHIKLASHTYSHPYYWPIFDGKKNADQSVYRYALYPDQYLAEIDRELIGAHQFVRQYQEKDVVLIWSGDGKPGPAVLATAETANIQHYGGGGYQWHSGPFTIADLLPHLRRTAWGTQVLTPLVGEPLFAKLWYGPAINYAKVSEWNQQLDLARRLRAHSLSFNADAFLRPQSQPLLNALVSERNAANVLSLWVHEYVARVTAFYHASVSKNVAGEYRFITDGLRTLRAPQLNTPLQLGSGVIGFSDSVNERYIHLSENDIQLQNKRTINAPNLMSANAPVLTWQYNETSGSALFSARESFQFTLSLPCKAWVNGKAVRPQKNMHGYLYQTNVQWAVAEVSFDCQ